MFGIISAPPEARIPSAVHRSLERKQELLPTAPEQALVWQHPRSPHGPCPSGPPPGGFRAARSWMSTSRARDHMSRASVGTRGLQEARLGGAPRQDLSEVREALPSRVAAREGGPRSAGCCFQKRRRVPRGCPRDHPRSPGHT